jgi:DNA polymerase-1
MQKLLLIDGNAMIHRAYHALPPLTNLKKEPVQAVYGFFSMLLNVLVDQKPTHLVVCFDMGKPTIRQTMFAGYHVHRPELADEFVNQIVIIHELLEKMKVAVFELAGYEGDDLIGTIAREAVEKKHEEVIILTGDRDMLQLVNKHVKVLMPLVGISKTVLFDEKAVEEKYGVKPSQFVDYKALIGDASDGYPGVTGIGPKTAATLLQKYETFENLYQKIEELPEKTGLKLATDAEQASLAKKLAAIMTDAPIQFDLKKCLCTDFDTKSLFVGFREQGFKTLTARWEAVFGKPEEQLGLL